MAAEWTHDSTAIEGNTLTLSETVKVLEFGLTISGKPLWDYQHATGTMTRGSQLLPPHPAIRQMETLLQGEWTKTVLLVEEARQLEKGACL